MFGKNKVKDFFNSKKIAVVGSFRDETTVAFKIVKYLLENNYTVYPVNPNTKEVLNINVYKSVDELPTDTEAIDIVTPPPVTEEIVKKCISKKIKKIWMQPGAESETAIKLCEDNDISLVYNTCILGVH